MSINFSTMEAGLVCEVHEEVVRQQTLESKKAPTLVAAVVFGQILGVFPISPADVQQSMRNLDQRYGQIKAE